VSLLIRLLRLYICGSKRAGQVYTMASWEALHPHAPLYKAWNTLLNINILYIFIIAPLQAGFQLEHVALKVLHTISTVCLFLDMIASCFVGFHVGKTLDHVERRILRVVKHYIMTWLVYDLATSLPWASVLPLIIGKTWITETKELAKSLLLIQIFRYLTISWRASFFTISSLHLKYSHRSILMFVLFALVRPRPSTRYLLSCLRSWKD
jgi:hypothetical protein